MGNLRLLCSGTLMGTALIEQNRQMSRTIPEESCFYLNPRNRRKLSRLNSRQIQCEREWRTLNEFSSEENKELIDSLLEKLMGLNESYREVQQYSRTPAAYNERMSQIRLQ